MKFALHQPSRYAGPVWIFLPPTSFNFTLPRERDHVLASWRVMPILNLSRWVAMEFGSSDCHQFENLVRTARGELSLDFPQRASGRPHLRTAASS